MLTPKQTANVVVSQNMSSARTAAGIVAGNIINKRLVKLVAPQLPFWAQGYVKSEIGHAVLANAAAGALIHFMPTNRKAQMAASAMIEAAMVEMASGLNIEKMVDDLFDGVDFSSLEEAVAGSEDGTEQ